MTESRWICYGGPLCGRSCRREQLYGLMGGYYRLDVTRWVWVQQ